MPDVTQLLIESGAVAQPRGVSHHRILAEMTSQACMYYQPSSPLLKLPTDDEPHYFVGTLQDGVHPQVSQHPLHLVLTQVAVSSQHLQPDLTIRAPL